MEPEQIKKHFIASMTNADLVFQLLDRAVSDLSQAEVFLEKGDLNGVHQLLLHAQAIYKKLEEMIQEEDSSSERTRAVLNCLTDALLRANLEKDPARIEEVRRIAQRLCTVYRSYWR